MIRGEDIICISSIDWGFIWQGHQQIMSALAAEGNRVLFIENTGVRTPRISDWPRLRQRFLNWRRGVGGIRQERENLFILSPLLLPFPFSRPARWMNRVLLLRILRRWMQAMHVRRPIVWTFLPTPLAEDLIRALDPALTVYYCIDDFGSSSSQARRIRRNEERVFRLADLVFATSTKLYERAARFNRRVHFFPFGVDYRTFEAVREQSEEGVPEELQRLPRPRIGYVGGLHQWIDQELLAAVARRVPEGSFVLIGPPQTDVSRLAQCPNVHLLGPKSHADVPRFIKGFDVGIVPYRLTQYTAHVYPTKLNEYLAMGVPVVATELAELRRFNAEHGELVRMAPDADAFVRALREAAAAAGERQQRIEAARANGWEARIEQMSDLIEEALAARQAAKERWQAVLRRLYWAARRRAAWLVLGVSVSYLLLFHSPAIWWLAEPLKLLSPPQPADVIVVLAGGVGESGKVGGGYQERVKQAVDLYRAGYAPRIIFSSGYHFIFPEAEVMKQLAELQGVPPGVIQLETRATNTHESAVVLGERLRRDGWRSMLLVSTPYHMRRAVWSFGHAAPKLRVIPSPVPVSEFYAHRRGATAEQIRGILQEYVAIVWYWMRGWV